MRILMVEDNALDADLVRRALRRSEPDATLAVAPTLAEARATLGAAGACDLVLLDLNLPDGRGLDLLAEIRQRRLPVAVLALTSLGDEDAVIAALRAGADDYLPKSEGFAERVAATARAMMARHCEDLARHARRLRVLYVEHNAVDVDLTQRHFAQTAPHLELVIARDAAAALARLPSHAQGADEAKPGIDVLLVDFRLAGDNGLELLKTVRRERVLDLPLVLVTGQGSEDVAALAMRLGATEYVVKRDGYLQTLPTVIENAFYRVQAQRERATLRALNQSLERLVAERTAELATAKDAAEAANRAKSDFLGRMSHELRTPLNAVLGFAQLLELDPAVKDSPTAPAQLRHVSAAGRHLLELVEDLLDLARIEAGDLKLSLERVELGALMAECVAMTAPLSDAHRVNVMCAPGAATLALDVDPVRLRQVVVNLLSNAIKYNRPGGRVDVALHDDGAEARIEVHDTGMGLSPDQLAQLFKPFDRVGAESSRIQGTGLGLVIVRQLVQAMGGRVEVRSDAGAGSTFTVSLPCAAPSAA